MYEKYGQFCLFLKLPRKQHPAFCSFEDGFSVVLNNPQQAWIPSNVSDFVIQVFSMKYKILPSSNLFNFFFSLSFSKSENIISFSSWAMYSSRKTDLIFVSHKYQVTELPSKHSPGHIYQGRNYKSEIMSTSFLLPIN